MIDKARTAIWVLAIGIFVIIEYYIFGKDHIPGYNVHKARAITFIFFGLATWLIPTKAPMFNRLGRFFVIIAIGNFIDEFFLDPYSKEPIEFIIGGLAALTLLPCRRLLNRLKH
jgi:uncharacterized phage infection (PIP) family protein YhgE